MTPKQVASDPYPLNTSYFLQLAPPVGYLFISLIATWPLITHLKGWVPGFGDWGQNMWALWWTRHSLLSLGQTPFFTNYLFYPDGVSLLFHPLDVSDGLLALPLYGLWGGDISYNVMILLSYLLSAWGTYLLAFYLSHNRVASFIAGLVFMLSPYHFLRIDLGHLNLSTIQWIPFYTLFLLKFGQQGSKRAGILAVFFLVFTALNSWYYVVYCGLLSLAMIFWPLQYKTLGPKLSLGPRVSYGWVKPGLISGFFVRAGRILGVLFMSLFILLPLLIPMFQLLGSTTLIGSHDPLRHSVDLDSFWLPGPPSTWASWFEVSWLAYAAQNREPGASAYLGYTVLLISLLGLFSRRGRWQALWWWLLGFGFALLALGPQLQQQGQLMGIALPYHWLATFIPIFSITGIPGRFVVMTSLALAMTTGYGLSFLADWLVKKMPLLSNPSISQPWIRRPISYLYLLLGVLICLEYLAVPLRLSSTKVTDFYHVAAAEIESYSILDIKWDANVLMYAQTVHKKPLIGGWLARLPEEQAAYLDQGSLDQVFVRLLLGEAGLTLTDPAAIQNAVKAELSARQVRYIVDHDRVAGVWLEPLLGWPIVYETDNLAVYGNVE